MKDLSKAFNHGHRSQDQQQKDVPQPFKSQKIFKLLSVNGQAIIWERHLQKQIERTP